MTEGVENWLGWLGKVVIVVVLGIVVFVITGKGKNNFRTKCWVGTDLVWAEFTVITEGREVAGESMDECLLS